MANILITGGSRGLGHGFSLGVPDTGDTLWLVSRSRPQSLDRQDGVARHWIEADLAQREAGAKIAAAFGERPLDLLLYNAGTWEHNAFSSGYDPTRVSASETEEVLRVNLLSAITCVSQLLPNLRKASTGRIILIGSTSGMGNNRQPELAYNASKFGLRGLAQALRQSLRGDGISITCINPGSICTALPYEQGRDAVLRSYGKEMLPMHDLVALVRCVRQLSAATQVSEIDVPSMGDVQA